MREDNERERSACAYGLRGCCPRLDAKRECEKKVRERRASARKREKVLRARTALDQFADKRSKRDRRLEKSRRCYVLASRSGFPSRESPSSCWRKRDFSALYRRENVVARDAKGMNVDYRALGVFRLIERANALSNL